MPNTITTTELEVRFDEIAKMVADLFSVSPEEVHSAISFVDDLAADSLLAIELLTQLEKRYQVSIPEDELPNLVNLKSTYDVVAARAGW
jgi:acyl carrier protein